MKKLLLLFFIGIYSFFLYFLENPFPQTKFALLMAIFNVLFLVLESFLTYKFLKFLIEIVENNISKNTNREVSKKFIYIFICVFFIRMVLLFLNIKLMLLSTFSLFMLIYFSAVVVSLFFILNKYKKKTYNLELFYSTLPIIIFIFLDIYLLKRLWG